MKFKKFVSSLLALLLFCFPMLAYAEEIGEQPVDNTRIIEDSKSVFSKTETFNLEPGDSVELPNSQLARVRYTPLLTFSGRCYSDSMALTDEYATYEMRAWLASGGYSDNPVTNVQLQEVGGYVAASSTFAPNGRTYINDNIPISRTTNYKFYLYNNSTTQITVQIVLYTW